MCVCVCVCVCVWTEAAVVELQQQWSSRRVMLPAELLHSLSSVETLPNTLSPAVFSVSVCFVLSCVFMYLWSLVAELQKNYPVFLAVSSHPPSPPPAALFLASDWSTETNRKTNVFPHTPNHTHICCSINMIFKRLLNPFRISSCDSCAFLE